MSLPPPLVLILVPVKINCFRAILSTTPQDLLPAIYLCTNKVAPAHHGVELGVGEMIILKAVAAATGRTEARIREALKEEGDLGTIAVKVRSSWSLCRIHSSSPKRLLTLILPSPSAP